MSKSISDKKMSAIVLSSNQTAEVQPTDIRSAIRYNEQDRQTTSIGRLVDWTIVRTETSVRGISAMEPAIASIVMLRVKHQLYQDEDSTPWPNTQALQTHRKSTQQPDTAPASGIPYCPAEPMSLRSSSTNIGYSTSKEIQYMETVTPALRRSRHRYPLKQ